MSETNPPCNCNGDPDDPSDHYYSCPQYEDLHEYKPCQMCKPEWQPHCGYCGGEHLAVARAIEEVRRR